MPKVLCIIGMVVAGLLLLVFGIDAAAEFPFGRASMLMDISMIVCSLILGYLGWATWRQQT
ncbi:MAG: hypothetical protein ACLQLG_16560 [Thermoguttaceae bacterium]